MARYGKEHKEATRRRIIEAAGRRLKRDGIDGSGVATLMADAGLTNGAFYAHFASKDDLVATAVADQLREQLERYRGQAAGRAASSSWSASTCRSEHRDDRRAGCPSAALLDEIGRCTACHQAAPTPTACWRIADEIAARPRPRRSPSRRARRRSASSRC